MKEIGEKIRWFRAEKRMTLEELAQRSGLSKSFLSQAERGQSSMTLTSLQRIAEGLDLTLAEFFQPPTPEPAVPRIVRAAERPEFRIEAMEQATYSSLGADFPEKKLEPVLITLAPTGKGRVHQYTHPGEEFTLVFDGVLTVLFNDQEFTLGPGDSIHMPSTVPHAWENRTEKVIQVLCVSTPRVL